MTDNNNSNEDFALPDLSSIFDQYEVEDKEHPVYTAFNTPNERTVHNERTANTVPRKQVNKTPNKPLNADPVNTPYTPVRDDESQSGVHAHSAPKRRSAGHVGTVNNASTDTHGHTATNEHNRDNESTLNSNSKRKKPVKRKKTEREPVLMNDDDLEDSHHVDKRTGVAYELLPGSDGEALKAYKSSGGKGLSLDEMFRYTDLADGFNGIDLASDAKRFLPHLQVPMSKKEKDTARKKLRDANNKNGSE